MKRSFHIGLILALLTTTSLRSQEEDPLVYCSTQPQHQHHPHESSRYVTRDATVFSMMAWGIGLAVAIAVLCGMMETNGPSS